MKHNWLLSGKEHLSMGNQNWSLLPRIANLNIQISHSFIMKHICQTEKICQPFLLDNLGRFMKKYRNLTITGCHFCCGVVKIRLESFFIDRWPQHKSLATAMQEPAWQQNEFKAEVVYKDWGSPHIALPKQCNFMLTALGVIFPLHKNVGVG